MSDYQAPRREMLFALRAIGGLEAVLAAHGDDAYDMETAEAVLDEAARFAGEVLSPLNRIGDRQGARWSDGGVVRAADGFAQAHAAFREAGWHGMPARTEFGGQGAPVLLSTAVLEMWKSANMAFSLCQMLTLGAVEAIARHADAALCATLLPPMVEGRWTGTMNLTEPQAGSDLAAIRSRAVPTGDGRYRITGTKIFITWGEHDVAENIVHLVLARLPDAPPGVKGISLFAVPKFLPRDDGSPGERNDLVCASIEHKLGIHGSPTAVMSFGEGGGALGWLVGQPHQGLACMFTMMNHARLNVGLEGVAIGERAYQAAREYALMRVQGRGIGLGEGDSATIIGHPDVRRMLMDMRARNEAGRALAYYTAARMDEAHGHGAGAAAAQALVDLLTPVVKGWCTESAQRVTADGVQVHGGMGYIEETGAAQHLRDARITTIYEGTTAIQANDLLNRKLARDGGAVATALLQRIAAEAETWAAGHVPALAALGRALSPAVAELAATCALQVARHGPQAREAAAATVPHLMQFGTVVGCWLLARGAAAAQAQLDADAAADAGFLQTRIAVARHAATHLLPEAAAAAAVVREGSASTLALDDAQF
ncbi:acyl-CoA dehydrogenase [Pseudaquabacterium rugosum]|uniref:Acyl-CoA dehydrogenase n=1 Tax=Pseudaquabacterium rugosum TaxID=2984194 RepID=A0ABU9B5N4_9BURK